MTVSVRKQLAAAIKKINESDAGVKINEMDDDDKTITLKLDTGDKSEDDDNDNDGDKDGVAERIDGLEKKLDTLIDAITGDGDDDKKDKDEGGDNDKVIKINLSEEDDDKKDDDSKKDDDDKDDKDKKDESLLNESLSQSLVDEIESIARDPSAEISNVQIKRNAVHFTQGDSHNAEDLIAYSTKGGNTGLLIVNQGDTHEIAPGRLADFLDPDDSQYYGESMVSESFITSHRDINTFNDFIEIMRVLQGPEQVTLKGGRAIITTDGSGGGFGSAIVSSSGSSKLRVTGSSGDMEGIDGTYSPAGLVARFNTGDSNDMRSLDILIDDNADFRSRQPRISESAAKIAAMDKGEFKQSIEEGLVSILSHGEYTDPAYKAYVDKMFGIKDLVTDDHPSV